MSGVLLTGAAGYIGSHILHRLEEFNYRGSVIAYDNLSAPNSGWVQHYDGMRYASIKDTGQLGLTCARYCINTVIHLAARIDVTESMQHPERYYRTNATYTANVVQGAARAGVKNFILASTAAVYGPSDMPIAETGRTAPANPYGKSKLMAEWIVQDLCHQYGIRCVILRFFNVAGADSLGRSGPMHKDSLFKVLARACLHDTAITIYGNDHPTDDGYAIRDYVAVQDIAAAHVELVYAFERGMDLSGVFNLGTGCGLSVNEVIQLFEEANGKPIKRIIAPRRPGEVSYAVAGTDKAKVAGLLPIRTPLRSVVKQALAWETKLMKGELNNG